MPVLSPMIYILTHEISSFIIWEITTAFGILSMDSFNQGGACGSFQGVGDVQLWTWMVVYREKNSLFLLYPHTATTLHF